jgi:hypothetical protein
MSERRQENMRRLNGDPEFAAARDERAQERFAAENARLQRLANVAKRGCDVPRWLEDQWKALKQVKVSNKDAADMLNIPWLGDHEDAVDVQWAARRASSLVDDLVGKIKTAPDMDPDTAFDLISLCGNIKRVLAWNQQQVSR